MNGAAWRRRATARQGVEVLLEHPCLNRTASLGVHDSVTLTQQELRADRADGVVVARFHRHTRGWHLDSRQAMALGIPPGPWRRVSLRTPTGLSVLRVEADP